MATTYTLISSNVFSSNAMSVTFSAIPATYTDLMLRISGLTSYGNYYDDLKIIINSDTATNYSYTAVYGNGTSGGSLASSGLSFANARFCMNGSFSSGFGNAEVYIPNYLVSAHKQISSFGVAERNSADTNLGATAILWRNNASITSLILSSANNGTLQSNSSFYLYGIKNS